MRTPLAEDNADLPLVSPRMAVSGVRQALRRDGLPVLRSEVWIHMFVRKQRARREPPGERLPVFYG